MTLRSSSNRRVFMMQVATAAGATLVGHQAFAAAPMVAENDPQAVGVGYKADATKVDKAKYAKYAAGQVCGNCALYQGAAGSGSGGCGLFPGKQVSAKGWCSAYAKKG